MSTTIVFACKSNSCRSQMAEAWAREWIKAERERLDLDVENRNDAGDRQRRAFLDGVMVVSVALDESSVVDTSISSSIDIPPTLSSSPTSSITALFDSTSNNNSAIKQCVTCDGEICTSTSQRRRPKEKAIVAMAQDGVDISPYYAKTFSEVLPFVVSHHRRQSSSSDINNIKHHQVDLGLTNWKRHISFAGLRRVLEIASREMGMAFAGIARDNDGSSYSESIILAVEEETANERKSSEYHDNTQIVDNLIVLCSCPASMKRQLSDMSKETMDWDIDPPTAAAKLGEGDGAYLRVSRQIREKVHNFMDQLKKCALLVDDHNDGGDNSCWNVDLRDASSNNSEVLSSPLPT